MKSQVATLVSSWSSGKKDSAWALHALNTEVDEYKIVGCLLHLTVSLHRVAMHSTRREVLEAPLTCHCRSFRCLAVLQSRVCGQAIASGVEAIAFGDLFLEDIRRYRGRPSARLGPHSAVSDLGTGDARSPSRNDWSGAQGAHRLRRPKEDAWRAWPGAIWMRHSARNTAHRHRSKTASSTPASTPGQCFVKQYRSKARGGRARWLCFCLTYGLKSNKVSPTPWSAAQPVWAGHSSCCAVLFRVEAVSVTWRPGRSRPSSRAHSLPIADCVG